MLKKHYIILSSLFFSSRHVEHSLRTQFFWPSYNTRYISKYIYIYIYIYILNIFCSYSKALFKFCQSQNFVASSHFYILLFFAGISYIRIILKSSIFQFDKEIKMLSQYIFLTQINKFFREKEAPFQVIEAVHYMQR